MSVPVSTPMPTTTRNSTLLDLQQILRKQQNCKFDAVVPASAIRSRNGIITVADIEPMLTESGVTLRPGHYRPTASADGDIATKLGIDTRYLRKLRTYRPDLYDLNVNGWLHGKTRRSTTGATQVVHPADRRSFMLRMFHDEDGHEGVLRAMLSDRYGIIDHLDVLSAVLAGIKEADTSIEVHSCDLSETSMHVKVYSRQVAALAPHFLRGYRSPWSDPELEAERRRASPQIDHARRLAAATGEGYALGDEPVVFAGFRFSNSEVGKGAVVLKPELRVQICNNGLTLPLLAQRALHIGTRLDNGSVEWSDDTVRKQLAVVTAKTRDVVATWLSPQFLREQVNELEKQGTKPVREPTNTIKEVGAKLRIPQHEQDSIIRHFIAGGQLNAAGIANAITSFSQTVPDPDRADELDDLALKAMAEV